MKNLITITSLLAAGTLCANAVEAFDAENNYSFTWDFSTTAAQLGGTAGPDGAYFTTSAETIGGVEKTVLTAGLFYELGTSVLYDAIKAAYDGQGVLTFNMLLNWDGTNEVESILHVGARDTGITLGVTSNGKLTFARGSAYNADVSSLQLTENTWQTVSFSLGENGKTTISIDETTIDGIVLNWEGSGAGSGMNWSSDSEERNKYSIGTSAPGYDEYRLDHVKVADLGFVYSAASVPEPSAFGLLAGAGALALVAARRRRQKKA